MITHRTRLENCLSGIPNDRIPVALWRHFPVDDQTPEGLASSTLAYQKTYQWDLVKVTPASSFCLKDWGSLDEWRGATEGTRDYTRRVIENPEDWGKLPVLDPLTGHLADQIKCLKYLVKELGDQTPIIQTIFSPLSQAKNLVGGANLLVHIRQHPDALIAGLEIISESTIRFIEEIKSLGIAGIFYAVQHAQYELLTVDEYAKFGKEFDLQILASTQPLWLNMLHLHGLNVMFKEFFDYPVQVINWHDRETPPTLKEAQSRYPGVVCGGIQRERTLVLGSPTDVLAEAKDAIRSTTGSRFILGTGCVVPITAPHGNLLAVKQSVVD